MQSVSPTSQLALSSCIHGTGRSGVLDTQQIQGSLFLLFGHLPLVQYIRIPSTPLGDSVVRRGLQCEDVLFERKWIDELHKPSATVGST